MKNDAWKFDKPDNNADRMRADIKAENAGRRVYDPNDFLVGDLMEIRKDLEKLHSEQYADHDVSMSYLSTEEDILEKIDDLIARLM